MGRRKKGCRKVGRRKIGHHKNACRKIERRNMGHRKMRRHKIGPHKIEFFKNRASILDRRYPFE